MNEPERHESYGRMGFSRGQGREMSLFGSSILHQHHIILEIETATRMRRLSQDRIQGDEVVLRAVMSQDQFDSAMSGINQGSGVPITLQYVSGDDHIREDPPRPRRREEFQEEVEDNLRETLEELDGIIESAPPGPVRKRLETLRGRLKSNLPFLQDQFQKQMERSVAEAKAEIDSFMTQRERAAGMAAQAAGTAALACGEKT